MLRRILDRPVTVTMALLVVMVLGIVSMRMLPVSLIPDIDIPYLTVQVSSPSLSAREVEETVARPLRQSLVQMQQLEDMKCESSDGGAVIRLTFSQGADMDYLFIEANEKIDRTMGQLKGIDRPKVFKSGASDIPAFYINMTCKDGTSASWEGLSSFASQVVAKRIEQLDEVAMVDLSGCVDKEILIVPDTEKLRLLSLTEKDFESLVRAANVRLGSLSIRDGEYRYSVKFQSFASERKDIEDIYLKVGDRLLQVKDIARVEERPAERVGLVRSDGRDAVSMAIIKQSDARMSDLKKSIGTLLDRFVTDYPDLDFVLTRDQTELLEYSIDNLVWNIITGIILACLVIFLFMKDFRSPALVALTIPAALVLSMAVFYLIGLSINIISLSGLVLGVGMMVDNTIILTDNITARWQRGEGLRRAVLYGTSEVTGPMLSSVLTTCAVFVPLVFLSGTAGAIFYDQAVAVTVVLLSAYLITVTVIPVYYWCWYRKLPAFRPNAFLERFSFGFMLRWYESGLVWLLRHRWAGWGVFSVSAAALVLCLVFMPKEKLPQITYADTVLKVSWNDQITLEENLRRTEMLEAVSDGAAVQSTSFVGIQQFILGHSGEQGISETSVYFKCADKDALARLKSELSVFFGNEFPDAGYGFETSGNIFDMVFTDNEADIVARVRPVSGGLPEPESLSRTVGMLAEALPEAGIPPVPVRTNVLYVADPERMALYGVSYDDLVSVLRNALNSNSLFNIVQGNKTLPVVMGFNVEDMDAIIGNTYVRGKDSDIPASALLKQTLDADLKNIISGPEGIYYPVEIPFEGNDPSPLMGRVRHIISDSGIFDVGFSGSWFADMKMVRELLVILLIAVLLLYLILASQFESLLQPLVILSELVIDIAASLVVLSLFGVSVNLMSLIGLVVVSGIVINDSILKIDTINRLRKGGMVLRHAVMEAGHRRLKAILMTSLTTILSVSPFLSRGSMGDDLQYPLSLVIVAGMTAGTIVSLFFVPMVYYAIYAGKEGGR